MNARSAVVSGPDFVDGSEEASWVLIEDVSRGSRERCLEGIENSCVVVHGRIDGPSAAGCERNTEAAAVVGVEGAGDEPLFLEPIEATRHPGS